MLAGIYHYCSPDARLGVRAGFARVAAFYRWTLSKLRHPIDKYRAQRAYRTAVDALMARGLPAEIALQIADLAFPLGKTCKYARF